MRKSSHTRPRRSEIQFNNLLSIPVPTRLALVFPQHLSLYGCVGSLRVTLGIRCLARV